MTRPISAIILCTALSAAACGGSATPVPTGPTGPLITENFTGTVTTGARGTHTFIIKEGDQLTTVALTQAGPPATIFMGLGIGSWNASTSQCTLLQGGTVQASTTPQLSGYTNVGTYCVQVLDAGNIPEGQSITYAVTVTHY
jgi:hypothetical protein